MVSVQSPISISELLQVQQGGHYFRVAVFVIILVFYDRQWLPVLIFQQVGAGALIKVSRAECEIAVFGCRTRSG